MSPFTLGEKADAYGMTAEVAVYAEYPSSRRDLLFFPCS